MKRLVVVLIVIALLALAVPVHAQGSTSCATVVYSQLLRGGVGYDAPVLVWVPGGVQVDYVWTWQQLIWIGGQMHSVPWALVRYNGVSGYLPAWSIGGCN